MEEIRKLSKLLATEEKILVHLFGEKKNLAKIIIRENNHKINSLLNDASLKKRDWQEVCFFLRRKHQKIINFFLSLLEKQKKERNLSLADFILKERNYPQGEFLKIEKIKEILFLEKPKKIMAHFSFRRVEELFEKIDIWEILASLRFVEGIDWLNKKFLPYYLSLKASDFEKRQIKIIELSEKWSPLAKKFIKKKFHNISHLKEFGLIFIIPLKESSQEKFFCDFALIFHYLREIEFFDQLFRSFRKKRDWQRNLIKSLEGIKPEEKNKTRANNWLIFSQYLAKINKNDWRLALPHLNSESCHWYRATTDLVKLGKKIGLKDEDLKFWQGTNWLGDFFFRDKKEELVSFNFLDISLSLANERKEFYSYHFHEALWNRIFEKIFPQRRIEEELQKNWLRGKIV